MQLVGGAVLIAGLYFTARGFRLTREGHITDRYAKAVEQLGHEAADVRIGGIFALYLTHTVLSVSAAVGFITLFGVAVMDGVLLITYIRQAREKHGGDAKDAILDAVSQRLRPVLMTALLASLGLLPAALSHSIGSDAQRPFAIVIIGGLISSTLLTMLLLPTLYELFDKWFGSGLEERRAARAAAR